MVKAPKPDLDDATLRIARTMLNTPPKPHDEMKLGARKPKARPKARAASAKRKTA
jgi:hypothetical protein